MSDRNMRKSAVGKVVSDKMDKKMCIRDSRESMTYTTSSLKELKEIADTKPGFIKAMWCGDPVSYTHLDVYKRQFRKAPASVFCA